MNAFQGIILIGLGGNALIGLLVLFSNPKRRLNRYFFLTTFLVALWLLCMFAITLQSSDTLLFWTRQVSAAAGFLPLVFFILRLAILEPELTFFRLFHKIRYLLFASFLIVILCQTPFFVHSTYFPSLLETVPVSDYGPGFVFYNLYFIAMVIAMAVSFRKTIKNSFGAQRTEIQFLLLGGLLSFSFGLVLFTVSNLIDTQEATRFLPLFALIMNGFVAYGIATRRILSVSVVLQRVVSYLVMGLYLIGIYMGAVWLGGFLFYLMVPDTTYLSYLLAALVLALSVVPAHGRMQAVSHRLFAGKDSINTDWILERAGHLFREVATEENLSVLFVDLISTNFDTSGAVLLQAEEGASSFTQHFPEPEKERTLSLDKTASIVRLLERDHEAFTADTLVRMRPSPRVVGARKDLKTFDMAIAVGGFVRKNLSIVLLLPSKRSGGIYDLREQNALQLLCDQFAVALENSRLYTDVQNGKIYNDILLDSLVSGVVAVNADHEVTVFNQRAQQISGVQETAVLNRPVDTLPPALQALLHPMLDTDSGFRDKDITIRRGDEAVPIRIGGSVFHGHTGKMLGALLIFSDMTLLKKMEAQIRRADRLASVGTLSAGMAHEIKNPLVTIKTFAQLLPHQYNDPDFQNTFFGLVGQEVKRIDTIVSRLLNFSRPAKAILKPTSLHKTVEDSLTLAARQFVRNSIRLEKELSADIDLIMADAEQLNQVFVNFFLNAIQSMDTGGTLTVSSRVVKSSADMPHGSHGPRGPVIDLAIADTGCGITEEDRQKIFDPFFTTKSDGVGLGLSISHGIIDEHSGVVDMESEPGKGTVFHLQFPLLEKKGEV